jgi:hypothetical protein
MNFTNLFYDENSHQFSTKKTSTNECVFLSYDGSEKEHIGWGKKNNETTIIKGNVKIIIRTNFWPERVKREFFYANIYINDILIRPISHCSYKQGNVSVPNYTVEMTHENFDWDVFLKEVCNICNHIDAWLIHELESLLANLPNDNSYLVEQVKILKLLRNYDSLNDFYVEKYRPHFDFLLFNMDNVRPYLESILSNGLQSSKDTFDTIWSYIKDYYPTS